MPTIATLACRSEGIGNLGSLFSQDTPVATPSSATDDIVWRDALSDLDLYFDFTPIRSLDIRPGVHFMKADVVSIDDGVTDPSLTLQTKTAMPEISFGYQPSKIFSIRGDVHSFDSGASYTAITPHTEVGGHLVTRVHFTPKFSLRRRDESQQQQISRHQLSQQCSLERVRLCPTR